MHLENESKKEHQSESILEAEYESKEENNFELRNEVEYETTRKEAQYESISVTPLWRANLTRKCDSSQCFVD